MNRNLELFTKIYKPYKITKKNSVYIFHTMDGDYVLKSNPKVDYKKLYNYLQSRNFSYLPELSFDSRDDIVVLEYQEDVPIDSHQKAFDLIHIVALLHAKTSYFKNVTNDKYKEIYDTLQNNLHYVDHLYDQYFLEYLKEEYMVPSHYLYLRNYSLIYNAIQYSFRALDEWYAKIKDKNRERVCLVHNNLRLEHLLKNKEEYLISWDHYAFDTPVLDLYHFYLNEWMHIDFLEVYQAYNDHFHLLEEERMLLDILISIPYSVSFEDSEIVNCRKVRELINYLSSSSKVVVGH